MPMKGFSRFSLKKRTKNDVFMSLCQEVVTRFSVQSVISVRNIEHLSQKDLAVKNKSPNFATI